MCWRLKSHNILYPQYSSFVKPFAQLNFHKRFAQRRTQKRLIFFPLDDKHVIRAAKPKHSEKKIHSCSFFHTLVSRKKVSFVEYSRESRPPKPGSARIMTSGFDCPVVKDETHYVCRNFDQKSWALKIELTVSLSKACSADSLEVMFCTSYSVFSRSTNWIIFFSVMLESSKYCQ